MDGTNTGKVSHRPALVAFSVTAPIAVAWGFIGHALVLGGSGRWLFPDIADIMDSSATVWGMPWGFAHVYQNNSDGLIAFPGFLLLAALLTYGIHALGGGMLSFAVDFTSHSSHGLTLVGPAWTPVLLFLGLLSAVPLFTIERLAQVLGVAGRRLVVLLIASSVTLLWMGVWWGHVDDSLAIAFLLWGVADLFDGRTHRAGWLLGAGLACQPLIVLALPVALTIPRSRQAVGVLVRMAIPPIAVLLPSFIGDFSDTYRQVVLQPALTKYLTPWYAIAPHVALKYESALRHAPDVSGGLGRTLALLGSLVLAGWVLTLRHRRRRELSASGLVWLMGVALSFRIVTEAALLPYYLAPVLMVLLIASATARRNQIATVTAGVISAIAISMHLGRWPYWILVTLTLVVTILSAGPTDLFEPGVTTPDQGGA